MLATALDMQPLVVALATIVTAVGALIVASIPVLLVRLSTRVADVHTLVNGQHTALVADLAAAHAQIASLTVAALHSATVAGSVESPAAALPLRPIPYGPYAPTPAAAAP